MIFLRKDIFKYNDLFNYAHLLKISFLIKFQIYLKFVNFNDSQSKENVINKYYLNRYKKYNLNK